MDEPTKVSLRRVLEMYESDERKHWEENGESANHIHHDLTRLREWLNREDAAKE